MKNKIFQSRDLCLRSLDTNPTCAKNVRRKDEKYAAQRRPVVALRGILYFATMSGYPITSSLPPIFSYKRWEMETTVRFSPARLSAYKTSCSVPTSRFAVISSSSRIDGFAATARAMDKAATVPVKTVHPCRAYHTPAPFRQSLHAVLPASPLRPHPLWKSSDQKA